MHGQPHVRFPFREVFNSSGSSHLRMQSLAGGALHVFFPKFRKNANWSRMPWDTEILVKAGSIVTWQLQFYHRLSKCWGPQSAGRASDMTDEQAGLCKDFVGTEKNTCFRISTELLIKNKLLWNMTPCHLITRHFGVDFCLHHQTSSSEAQ